MASELITGFAGTPHVGSDDMGAFQAGILGVGSYVLQTGQQLKATVASANKVTIGTGDLVMNGRHVRMATATDLTIQNGTQGQKRNDLIVCRYSKASDGKETATLVVVKGTATTGTPADPSYNKTSILDGASVSDMPLYRIPIANLSVGTPVKLFKVLTPLDTVGDSVTQLRWSSVLGNNRDTLNVIGRVAHGMIFANIDWINQSEFNSPAWKSVGLFRLTDITIKDFAYAFPCAENTGNDNAGSGMFTVVGNLVSWVHTGTTFNVPAGQWHRGTIMLPIG